MESSQFSPHALPHAGQAVEDGAAAGNESAVRLCSDLQALISSADADTRRARIRESLGRLGSAGLGCFRFESGIPARASIRQEWMEDLSGELQSVRLEDVWEEAIHAMPLWLHRWLLSRGKPFWLNRYLRYIPFSARRLLKATGPTGGMPLADLIVVTQPREPLHRGMFIGLHEPANLLRAEQIITLASAYLLARRVEQDDVPEAVLDLNERQIECLRWLVAGKSIKGVAAATGLSYANVRYHVERAKKLAGVASVQQLIALGAVRYGMSPAGPDADDTQTIA